MLKIMNLVETVIFCSRWLLAPLYLGLVAALLILMFDFFKVFGVFILGLWSIWRTRRSSARPSTWTRAVEGGSHRSNGDSALNSNRRPAVTAFPPSLLAARLDALSP